MNWRNWSCMSDLDKIEATLKEIKAMLVSLSATDSEDDEVEKA